MKSLSISSKVFPRQFNKLIYSTNKFCTYNNTSTNDDLTKEMNDSLKLFEIPTETINNLWNVSEFESKSLNKKESQLCNSLDNFLQIMNKRLNLISKIDNVSLKSIEFKFDELDYLFNTGFKRYNENINKLNLISNNKLIQPMNDLLNKIELEFSQNNIIHKEFFEWNIKYNLNQFLEISDSKSDSDLDSKTDSDYKISNINFPNIILSPINEIGCIEWHCQIRKVGFKNPKSFKLGIFFGPKTISNFDSILNIKAKLEVKINVRYKKQLLNNNLNSKSKIIIEESLKNNNLQINTTNNKNNKKKNGFINNSIKFTILANFIKNENGINKIMCWGKTITNYSTIN